ncbi:MAG: LysM domain-containing protein [bacterium]|nr:LysM domain-containing protein [bacterium]
MGSAKTKILNIATLGLVFALAGSTVYYYLKSQEASTIKQADKMTEPKQKTITDKENNTLSDSPKTSAAPNSAYTQPAASSGRPSNPAQTYIVGAGETLSGIASKLNMNWTRLSEINNLESGDQIKEGQILIIPSYDESSKKIFVEYKIDGQKSTQLQDESTRLSPAPYLDPATVAKTDSANIYGLSASDTFQFISKNEADGTAIVNATHLEKHYQIDLFQPVQKGKEGIWAIQKITPS